MKDGETPKEGKDMELWAHVMIDATAMGRIRDQQQNDHLKTVTAMGRLLSLHLRYDVRIVVFFVVRSSFIHHSFEKAERLRFSFQLEAYA